MAAKKIPADETVAVAHAQADRIRHLLRNRWADNQNEMARDVGCSQSTLSRAVRGEIQPGKRLLRLIAAHPAVNGEWLYRGRGKPLLPQEKSEAAQDCRLPLFKKLPSVFPGQLGKAAEAFPVPHALNAPSRCWYQLPESAAILRHREVALLPNDLLLLDYGISQLHTLFELSGKIAVAWVFPTPKSKDRRLDLGVLEYCQDSEEESLELVTGEPNPWQWKGVKRVEARILVKDKATGKDVDFGTQTVPARVDSEGRTKPLSANELHHDSYFIQPSDLVAVCVGMFRP